MIYRTVDSFGQALWQASSSTMPLGNFTGSHTPIVPASIAPQGPPPMPFPPGAPMLPTNLPVHAPPMLHQSVGSLHPGSCPGPHGMVAHQSHTSPGLCQPREPPPIHSSAPPTPAGGIHFKALEDRLDAAFTQKLETMAETFKASWTKPQQVHLVILFWHRALQPPWYLHLLYLLLWHLQPWTNLNKLVLGRPLFLILPSYQSRQSLLCLQNWPNQLKILQLHLDEEDHVHHRMLYLREDLEQDVGQSTDQGVTHNRPTRGSYGEKGSGPRHSHTATSSHHGVPSRTSRPPPSSTRDFAHPIYERSTMLRHSSPTTRSGRSRPTYQDVLPTIRINERESRANTGKHHSRNRPDPSATLRLRSRSREHRTKQRNQRGLFERECGVQIRAKARPTTPAAGSGTPQPEPEPPQTFDESLEMVIPASVDIPPSDWSQLSPELQEQGQEEGEPTPGNRTSLWRQEQNKSCLWIGPSWYYVLGPKSSYRKIRNLLTYSTLQESKYTTDDSGEYGFYFCLFWEDDTNSSCWIVHL